MKYLKHSGQTFENSSSISISNLKNGRNLNSLCVRIRSSEARWNTNMIKSELFQALVSTHIRIQSMWVFFFTFSLLLININCWNKTLNRNKKLLWWKKIVVMISFVPFLYWIKHDGRHHFLHEYNVLTQSLLLKLRSFKKRYCHHKTLIKSLFMKPPSMWRKNMFFHKEGMYIFLLPEFCPCHQLIPFYLQHLQCYPKCHIEAFERPQLRPQHIPKK